jgi:ABC-type multidrug transport system fused ATPase/permease subunit
LPWVNITEEKFYSVERVNNTLMDTNDERKNRNELDLNNNKLLQIIDKRSELPIIEFKNFYLKYNNTDNKYVLENVSFQIYQSQKIGIIGR